MFDAVAALSASVHSAIAFVTGLLVGSFLNVVILRYPKMIFHSWTKQSKEWLDLESDKSELPPTLLKPDSHCPQCKSPVKAWQNIPILSFILLRGKCAHCSEPIGWRYPFVELLTAVLSAVVVLKLGWSLPALFGVILTWILVALSFIDIDHQILPDEIVLPTLWFGLGLSLWGIYTQTPTAVIGAIAGYLAFWVVFQLFKLLTGKEGMGHGDFKLMALFGAWFGWQVLPQIVFISTLLGSIIGVSIMLINKSGKDTKIPFGPYIALAGWIAMLWGEQINQTYLNYAGI